MATIARPLAKCVLRWIYEQVHEALEMLKNMLLTLIGILDAQIVALRAWLAQWDYIARGEQWLWDQVQKGVEEVRARLTQTPEGPLAEFCPEFYSYLTEPAVAIFENLVATLTIFRNRLHDTISYMDEIDYLISIYEQWKADLLATIEILDDAILVSLSKAGDQVP